MIVASKDSEVSPALFRFREAAVAWGISIAFVKRLSQERKIHTIRIGTAVRIPREEVERIAREGVPA